MFNSVATTALSTSPMSYKKLCVLYRSENLLSPRRVSFYFVLRVFILAVDLVALLGPTGAATGAEDGGAGVWVTL